jgi:hypothetical protein
MRCLRWLSLSLLLILGTLFTLGLLSALSPHASDVHEMKVQLACKQLVFAAEAYRDHPANPGHQFPTGVADLIHPAWGGPSLDKYGEEEPHDPRGNPFRLEHRRTPDGTPSLVVWTAKPDGTRISQFGVGPLAEPRW